MDLLSLNQRSVYSLGLALVLLAAPGCRKKEAPRVVADPEPVYGMATSISTIDVANPYCAQRLVSGFYGGAGEWRWTAPDFVLLADPPEPPQPTFLTFDGSVPTELFGASGQVSVVARVNGIEVGRKSYRKPDRLFEAWPVPAAALRQKPARIEFSLSPGAVANGGPDGVPKGARFGLIVVSAGLKVNDDGRLNRATVAHLARQGQMRMQGIRERLLTPERQTELLQLFHRMPVWQETWYQNIRIEKLPTDLWVAQQLIYELRPDFIVETGTWRGGSALYWAHTLEDMGLEKSRVLTVDIQDLTASASAIPLWKKHVTFFKGSSTDPQIVTQIQNLVRGHKAIVMLDSDHASAHVLNELHAYAPMVPRGSYLIVEDTHIDGVPTDASFGPGPADALKKFLAEPAGQGFVPDRLREPYVFTFNPGGWLLRQ